MNLEQISHQIISPVLFDYQIFSFRVDIHNSFKSISFIDKITKLTGPYGLVKMDNVDIMKVLIADQINQKGIED